MISLSEKRRTELKDSFLGKKIIVVGDMMLDCYFWGDVKRISPEAPVPVVEIDNEFYRFGGAANCALNILKLGGIPFPIGIIGDDNDGNIFKLILKENGINSEGIMVDGNRPTTSKTRVIAQNQHVVRIDKESKEYISSKMEEMVYDHFLNIIDDAEGIILQDYNKGVLSDSLIRKIIKAGREKKKLITVDPKFTNFYSYENVTVFKPNRKEAGDILGTKIKTSEDVTLAGKILLQKLNAEYILLTLGEEGIAVFERAKDEKRMPTKARKVADVSGAGDTVISTLTMALAAGASITEASYLANFAGGIVCEEVGIVPIEREILFAEVQKDGVPA
jgi:D-glycero-beta-D-manno-heptose-7-phosphate kinase